MSEAGSGIKSRFGLHDHSCSPLSLVQGTPNLLKSAAKENLVSSSAVPSINNWDNEGEVGANCGVSSNRSFEICEDPLFWKDHNVQVIIRIRPLSNTELSLQGYNKCIRQESPQAITWTGHPESRFTFDLVADENVSQEKLFKVAGLPVIENCMGGYNSCMFAYGQTGSGKTYTMLGDIEGGTRRHSVNCGMTPRVFEQLFSRIQKEKEARRDEKLKFTCKISFLEIYNEQILDLLDPSSTNLQIREDSKKGVYVENLKEIEVTSARDVIQQLIQGSAKRKVAATNLNSASSRSHSVFTCIIESKWESQGVTHHRFARLNLVDLAGSERQKSSTAEGERFKEATNINKSLSTLGLVIMNLVSISNGKSVHVPYRDSKLTFLLQDSLGGNSKTIIIANINPSSCCSLETLSTLKFAQRAKFIENHAIVNEDAYGDVIAMRIQIQQLKREVSRLRGLVGGGSEFQDNDTSVVNFPGSPGSFKWEGLHESFSSLTSVKRMSQKKGYEVSPVGAFGREKDKEMTLRALATENQAAMQLAKQREDEMQRLRRRLRLREARIKRLEAVALGKNSAKIHLLKEKEEQLREIKVLRTQVDRKQMSKFALENLRLKEEIRRLKSFYEEGEREMINEQIIVLQNKLFEALEWKLTHESDQKINSDLAVEEVHRDGNLLISDQEPKSSCQSSVYEENEFLRLQAIQNQAEMDEIRKKLEVFLEEKEKLGSLVDDLTAQLEEEKSKAMKEGKQQMDHPSSSSDMPVVSFNDQLELKAMVDAIGGASLREAEAHGTLIKLYKENDELRMNLKVLIEYNNKLIELYELAASNSNPKTVDKAENTQEIGAIVDNTEKETELKRVVENLEHQLVEMNEENEKLMNLSERAMQERDDFRRVISSCGHKRVETGKMDCNEKLVIVDGGERDSGVSGCQEVQCRSESQDFNEPTLHGSSICAENGQCEENQASQPDEYVESDVTPRHVEENFLMEESALVTESQVNNEADVLVYSDMDIELTDLTARNLSLDLNCAREKLGKVDEKISDTARTLAALGCIEKALVEVDELSREIEVIQHDINVMRQKLESLNLLLSEAQERRTLVDIKFSALKYSLSSFSSSFSYFEEREVREREAVNASTYYLDQKKRKLAALQASKHGIENAQKKNQETEVELRVTIARIISKMEEENRKRESGKVLFAIGNLENKDCSQKNWHLIGKATELLKSEEEKTSLQAEMKLSNEKLVIIRKELGNLNKKAADVETEIQAVQLEIQKGLMNAEEKGLALERVMTEKKMLLEFRDNGMIGIENMILEYQQHVFESDLKKAEIKLLEEELLMKLRSFEELQDYRTSKET